MLKKIKTFLTTAAVLILSVYTLLFPYEIAYLMKEALSLCAGAVVPSLFMFTVLSRLLCIYVKSASPAGLVSRLFTKVTCLPASLFPICLLGLFSGAPAGMSGIGEIYSSGLCTRDEAERAAVLCNNCSAAFILSVAASVLDNPSLSVIILFSNIITTVFTYLMFFREKSDAARKTHSRHVSFSLSDAITSAVSESAVSSVKLCGYVAFFYTLCSVICQRLIRLLGNTGISHAGISVIRSLICIFLEMTSGVLSCGEIEGNIRLMLLSGAVAFCGISVMFQASAVAKEFGLSAKKLIQSKFLCFITSPLITLVLFTLSPKEVTVMNTVCQSIGGITAGDIISLSFVTCIAAAGAVILMYLDKKHKN